jgi:uncharacterized protein HemY
MKRNFLIKHWDKKTFEEQAKNLATTETKSIEKEEDIFDISNMSATDIHMKIKYYYKLKNIEMATKILDEALKHGYKGKRLEKWIDILKKGKYKQLVNAHEK